MNEQQKKLWSVLIPVICAVIMVCGFAVSGHITKNFDKDKPTAQSTTEPPTESTTPAYSKVSLIAVGDNLIHNTCVSAGEQEDGSYNFSSFYEKLKPEISGADIAVINQETILGGSSFEYSGYPVFNSPWEVGEAAIDAGFDIFTCATNHSMDKGFAGIEQECRFFDTHPEVAHLGTNDTEEDYNTILYYEKNSIRFAILNYTYGTNGIRLPSGKEWCVNMMEEQKISADIKTAKENADVVIVFPHWGTENSTSVSDYQQEYIKLFANLGVDIVIGTHPHVLQPVEWVERGDGKKMLVYYSLGNFVSHQTSLNQLCGGMAKISIEKRAGEISITSAKLIPVVCWYKSSDGKFSFAVYKLKDYTDELAASHNQSGAGATPEYFRNYAKKVVDSEFLEID